MPSLVGAARKKREYAAFEEGGPAGAATAAAAGGAGVAGAGGSGRTPAVAATAAAAGGGGGSGGGYIGSAWAAQNRRASSSEIPFFVTPPTDARGGGGAGPGGLMPRSSIAVAATGGRVVGGGSWVLPPDPPRRRLREALCCWRMSPMQALFLLAQLSCLVYFTVDAWTGRRVLRLFYLTLEDIPPPHHAPLLTTAFFGMGLVFVALGFPTTLLAVLGGHVYGRLLPDGGYLGVLVASIVTTATAGLGCLASFLLTKGMLRDCASERLHSRATLEGVDTALRQQGLKVNLLLRLCPLVPYNLMNLLLGLTATRVEDYAIGCFVGMLPPVILLSHFGAGLDTPEAIGDFPASHRTEMAVIYGVGGGILLLTLLLLWRSTRRAMADATRRKQSLVDSIGWEM